MPKPVERVAVVGAGVIGSGWAARFLGAGLDVAAWDPAPDAEGKALAAIDVAWRAMARRGLAPDASPSRLTFHANVEDCVAGADFVQENAPEREALKQDLLARIDAANPAAIVASSTSGLLPTVLSAKMKRPERMLVGHPFNPVYLLPLVELVGAEKTAAERLTAPPRFTVSSACVRCRCARRSWDSSPIA